MNTTDAITGTLGLWTLTLWGTLFMAWRNSNTPSAPTAPVAPTSPTDPTKLESTSPQDDDTKPDIIAIVRPCAGDDPALRANLLSVAANLLDSPTHRNTRVLHLVAHNDPGRSIVAAATEQLRTQGINADCQITHPQGANHKVAQLAEAEGHTATQDTDIWTVVDCDVRLDDFNLAALWRPLAADTHINAPHAPVSTSIAANTRIAGTRVAGKDIDAPHVANRTSITAHNHFAGARIADTHLDDAHVADGRHTTNGTSIDGGTRIADSVAIDGATRTRIAADTHTTHGSVVTDDSRITGATRIAATWTPFCEATADGGERERERVRVSVRVSTDASPDAWRTRLPARLSEAVLNGSLHSFPLLAGLDPNTVVGKVLAIRTRSLRALGGWAAFADYLGEDMQLGIHLRAQGEAVQAVPQVARAVAERRDFAAVFQRYVRWLLVIRGQRPALLMTYPLVFFPTFPLLIACFLLAARAPTRAHVAAALLIGAMAATGRLAVAALARLRCGDTPTFIRAVSDSFLADGMLLIATLRAVVSPQVAWRGRPLRVARGGKLVATGALRVNASADAGMH